MKVIGKEIREGFTVYDIQTLIQEIINRDANIVLSDELTLGELKAFCQRIQSGFGPL